MQYHSFSIINQIRLIDNENWTKLVLRILIKQEHKSTRKKINCPHFSFISILNLKYIQNQNRSHYRYCNGTRILQLSHINKNMQHQPLLVIFIFIKLYLADLLITSVSISDDSISKITSYNFQIIRFGTPNPIPSGAIVEITFPNAYINTNVSACIPSGWNGATTLSCSYSQFKLTIADGFPTASNVQNFGFQAQGILNPSTAKIYSSFTIKLLYLNGDSQVGSGGYSVTITTAQAQCSLHLKYGLVFGEGLMEITYNSQFINQSSTGFKMKLSMLQSYPSDPTNTDINPVLNVSSTMLATYLFEFPFTNIFTLSMLMPPSTQIERNFIFIMTSNVQGDYDKCYLNIEGVRPNTYVTLQIAQGQVQTTGNLQIKFLSVTPILPSDIIRINFTNTDFALTQISNYATFTKGVIGQKQLSKTGQVITIRNLASFTIISEVNFYLSNIDFPYSAKPQSLSVIIQTDSGFLRSSQTISYTSLPAKLENATFSCLTSEIGHTTSCTVSFVTNNFIDNNSSVDIKFPFGFQISNGFVQCPSSGPNLNTRSNCNSYALTNTIKVTGMVSNSNGIAASSRIDITVPSFNLPTTPGVYNIVLSTKTKQEYVIDEAQISFSIVPRLLLNSEITITSESQITNTQSRLTVIVSLPLNLGIPFNLLIYIPLQNISAPSVNGNLILSQYSKTSNILKISNIPNSEITITGFLSYQSTKPVTFSGNFTFNQIIYFYFKGYDISMSLPREMSAFSLSQSNSIVGKMFKATIIASTIKQNDIIKIPTSSYSISQPDCGSNTLCGSNGEIRVFDVNNYGTDLTLITVNLLNAGYVTTINFNITVFSQDGIYKKQTVNAAIRTSITNLLNISSSQSNPYYLQSSIYTFQINMTTPPPAQSTNNFLVVVVPSNYAIQSWTCITGCSSAPSLPISGTVYFPISSTKITFTLKLMNPITFSNSIRMTSTSLGDMDSGTYLPVSPCMNPCRSCSPTNTSFCLSCYQWSSQNKLRNNTCLSNCPTGQFYNSVTLICELCHSYCLSCINSSTLCYSCKSNYVYFNFTCLTICPPKYYPSASSQCVSCSNDCIRCTNFTSCNSCANNTFLYLGSCWASCQQGTYVNPIANQCINCTSNCVNCDSNGCLRCQNNFYLYNKLCYQQCPSGLFKATTTCESCQPPCSTCSIYSTNCTGCVLKIGSTPYYYLNNKCYQNKCPDTFYLSSLGNNCLKCQSPCLNCNSIQCLTCQTGYYYYQGLCSTVCPLGTYSDTNITCTQCPLGCSSCISANFCRSCTSPYSLFNTSCLLECPDKFYPQSNICKNCLNPCFTCSTQTVCSSCLSLSYYNGSCLSNCPFGFYSIAVNVLNQTLKQCNNCIYPCSSCLSNTTCLSCTNNLKLFNSTCYPSCPTQFYDNNGICFPCSLPCKTCNITGCLSCSDSRVYLQRQQCLNSCTDLHPNNRTMTCQSCVFPCGTCTWSNVCLSCLDPYVFSQGECVLNCPPGKYNSSRTCVTCPLLCDTCYLLSDQLRCPTCKNGALAYGFDCVESCPINTRLESPFCLSAQCKSLTNCNTCSNLRCLQCSSNYTLNSTSGKCQNIPTEGSIISAISQIPVPFPFLIATILIIISAFLIRISFDKMYTPLFIYSLAGLAECGDLALWIGLIYSKGIGEGDAGNILRIIATVIIGIYFLFNIISFILYLKITKKDTKFRVWQNQDNKSASICVTIISLTISFRFSLLKYSKLGHLQKFSATLSNNSKLSHQNVMAYISIGIINLPMLVVSAWTANIQTKMNYLFFTSLEVSVLAIVLIILSIIQSLSPKDYILEKRNQYKQGFDSDGIDGQSLSQMMMKLGIVQQEYHQNKEIKSDEQEVGRKNQFNNSQYSREDIKTSDAFAFTKGIDDKLSMEDIVSREFEQQGIRKKSKGENGGIPYRNEIQELETILREAEKRGQQLNRPVRPIGYIRRQKFHDLQQGDKSSEQIEQEDDDEPSPINSAINQERKNKTAKGLRSEEALNLNDLRSFLDIEERRVGMKMLDQLFDKLQMQEKEQKQLRQKLEKLTEEQKILKEKQYEKARQQMERNQMTVEDKLSAIQELLIKRVKHEEKRKQQIKQIEIKRRQQRQYKREQKSMKRALVYPVHDQQEVSKQTMLVSEKEIKEDEEEEEHQWNENQQNFMFQKNNNQWDINQKISTPQLSQRLPLPVQEKTNKWERSDNHLTPQLSEKGALTAQRKVSLESQKTPLNTEFLEQLDHWPIEPQLQSKIIEIQEKAQSYINAKQSKIDYIEQIDMELVQNRENEDIIFSEEQQQNKIVDKEQYIQQYPQLVLDENIKIPKKRVNRAVIDLSKAKTIWKSEFK